ncbi:MAG: hypothetical protein H6744_16100 [Deltaproteobacteria bacterium]|nr:hypothetical protein [Deltaproteobacteria bacterium]
MSEESRRQKRDKMLELLERGMVMIHLDPRAPGVVVPPRFGQDTVLRLNVAWQFQLPALEIGEDSIYAVLSFQRQNFGCTLPWDAIFGLTMPDDEHQGMLWPASMPPELDPFFAPPDTPPGDPGGGVPVLVAPRPALAPQRARSQRASGPPTGPRSLEAVPRRGLAVIKGGAATGDTDPPPESGGAPPEPGPPRQRPSLKIVKD